MSVLGDLSAKVNNSFLSLGGGALTGNLGLTGKLDVIGNLDLTGELRCQGYQLGIESMGDGYIRYDNGLQICYGTVQFTASLTTAWGSLYEATTSSVTSYTFAKAFNKTPWLSATVSSGNAVFIEVAKATTTTASVTYVARPNSSTITSSIDYIAIGTWK